MKPTCRTQQSRSKTPGFTGTSKSGEDKNAKNKGKDQEILAVTAQEVPRIAFPKLTPVYPVSPLTCLYQS